VPLSRTRRASTPTLYSGRCVRGRAHEIIILFFWLGRGVHRDPNGPSVDRSSSACWCDRALARSRLQAVTAVGPTRVDMHPYAQRVALPFDRAPVPPAHTHTYPLVRSRCTLSRTAAAPWLPRHRDSGAGETLGTVREVHTYWWTYDPLPAWRQLLRGRGGALADRGLHLLSQADGMLGPQRPVRVTARAWGPVSASCPASSLSSSSRGGSSPLYQLRALAFSGILEFFCPNDVCLLFPEIRCIR
jgi:hypothetical protein